MSAPDLPTEVRSTLRTFGLKLDKRLGQHFLIDQEILDVILDAAQIEDTDHIVEIGPGIGILTRELLKDAKTVTAIELDARMIPVLTQFVGPTLKPKLKIIEGNALRVPLPTEPYKIVANIPYHITSPLLRHAFLQSPLRPTTMTLLIQREVAEKICDKESAGMLTILVGLFGEPSVETIVPPSAFLPPPEVDSAVLHIRCFPKPLADPGTIDEVFRLTKIAFGQKRKMLRNSLGSLPEGPAIMETASIAPTRRPETLSIDEWIALANAALETAPDPAAGTAPPPAPPPQRRRGDDTRAVPRTHGTPKNASS